MTTRSCRRARSTRAAGGPAHRLEGIRREVLEVTFGEARAAFLEGYGGVAPDEAPLLAAFELENACYEVAYEANNRPDWVWLPLEALERQMGER